MASGRGEERPLLPSTRRHINDEPADNSIISRTRKSLRWFLDSRYGHYAVIVLVAVDVAGIFADFLIKLHMCEHASDNLQLWQDFDKALDILSLVFSCLFMAELLCSIYAFGFQYDLYYPSLRVIAVLIASRYFKSKFHVFDALSILASFIVDVCTTGLVEEAGSLIIVLRLFRVFKIVEESSTVAEDTLEKYREKVSKLEKENASLRQRHAATKLHQMASERRRSLSDAAIR